MSKAKTAGEKATASAETVLENGAAAMKTGLEKALKGYDAFVGYGKETADAVTKSATVAGKGIESINSEIYSYSKQSIEDAVTANDQEWARLVGIQSTLEALDAVKGDLSNGQKAYRDALQKTNFKGPAGEVKIDANRNGVGTTYITEVTKAPDGSFYNKVVKTVPNISQTLGLPEAEFKKMGLGSRDVPDCRK
jgi:hypothetical protein